MAENMTTSKNEIFENAKSIVNDLENMSLTDLDVKYSDFKSKFPKVFDMCLLSGQDAIVKLSILLNIREEILVGSKSDIEGNVQVSEYFAKQYVYNKGILAEPTMEQKKTALKKIIADEIKKKEDAKNGIDPHENDTVINLQ